MHVRDKTQLSNLRNQNTRNYRIDWGDWFKLTLFCKTRCVITLWKPGSLDEKFHNIIMYRRLSVALVFIQVNGSLDINHRLFLIGRNENMKNRKKI